MKPLKLLRLAGLLALMTMALHAPSATATPNTSLCTADVKDCEGENIVTHIHETGEATLLSVIDVECDVLFLGHTVEAGPLVLAGDFTYTNCTDGCSVGEVEGPVEIEVLKTGHETASFVPEGLLNVECGFVIECTYSLLGLSGIVKGPLLAGQKNGEVSIQEQELDSVAGFFCPTTTKLDLTLTPLSATYITVGMECIGPLEINDGLYASKNGNVCEGYLQGQKRYLLKPPGL